MQSPYNLHTLLPRPYLFALTHLPLNKMADNLAEDISKCIYINDFFYFDMGPIDNRPALVQLIAWHRTGDKPLSEPSLTQFTDAYMRH